MWDKDGTEENIVSGHGKSERWAVLERVGEILESSPGVERVGALYVPLAPPTTQSTRCRLRPHTNWMCHSKITRLTQGRWVAW